MTRAQEIADDLEQRIEQGEWPRNGPLRARKLPTRTALQDHYGAFSGILTEAIRILRVRGVVITRAGGGTYTRPPRPERIAVPCDDTAEWAEEEPEHKAVDAASWVREELQVDKGVTVRRVRRTLLRNGDVYALLDTYATTEGAEVGGVPPTAPADRIRTWLPADDEAVLLGMPQEVPVLALLNRVPGGLAVRIYPGDRIEYRPAA